MDTIVNDTQDIEVIERINRAKSHVKGWMDNIERWRKLYDMKHYSTKAKAGEIQYSDPTYTNTVDLSVGIMLANKLRWHAFGFEPSFREQNQTSRVEKLLDAILAINDEREEMNQLYQLYLNFCRDGGGAIYSIYDPIIHDESVFVREVADEDEGTKQVDALREIPLRVQVIDPESLIVLPGGPKRWLGIGRREARSVLDIEVLYDIKIPEFVGQTQDEKSQIYGEFVDWWDFVYVKETGEDKKETGRSKLAVRNTILYMGKPIKGPRIMDGYYDLPYTVQFFKPTGKDPDQWHSILQPLESSVALLERTFNRRAKQIDVFTGLPIVTKTQLGRAVSIDPGLYNHVKITPDESIEFPSWPGNPPDMNFHVDFLRSRIQQSGFSDVMFGSGVSQVAGYALSQLGDQNRIRLEQPITHLELLLTHWAKKALRLLNEFAPDMQVAVYGQYRGADFYEYVDIKDLMSYSIRSEIRPQFPNEETRKTAMATQVKGTLSDYTIMERYLGIEQPDDEEERKLIEAASRHPLLIEYGLMKELRRRATEENDKEAGLALQRMEAGLTQQGGKPQGQPNPEQLTGTQSATGEAVPQAAGGVPPGQSALEQQQSMSNAAPGMDGMIG